MTWLRDTYPSVSGVHLAAGGKHPRLVFTHADRTHAVPIASSPGDVNASRHAQQSLRRLLGEPQLQKEEDTMTTPTAAAEALFKKPTTSVLPPSMRADAPFNPPRVLPAMPTPAPKALTGRGRVAFYLGTNRQLTFRLPAELTQAVAPNDERLAYAFTAPDTFELTVAPDQAARGSAKPAVYKNEPKLRQLAFYHGVEGAPALFTGFGATPVECLVTDGTLLVRALAPLPIITVTAQKTAVTSAQVLTFHGKVTNSIDRIRMSTRDSKVVGLGGFSVKALGNDSWELRPSKRYGASFSDKSHVGNWILDASHKSADDTFPASPAVFTLADGVLTVKVTQRASKGKLLKKPVSIKIPAPTPEQVADLEKVLPPQPTVKQAVDGTMTPRAVIDALRHVEVTTPYRLKRVRDKVTQAERWAFVAPTIE